jgi:hypothetical protein
MNDLDQASDIYQAWDHSTGGSYNAAQSLDHSIGPQTANYFFKKQAVKKGF